MQKEPSTLNGRPKFSKKRTLKTCSGFHSQKHIQEKQVLNSNFTLRWLINRTFLNQRFRSTLTSDPKKRRVFTSFYMHRWPLASDQPKKRIAFVAKQSLKLSILPLKVNNIYNNTFFYLIINP